MWIDAAECGFCDGSIDTHASDVASSTWALECDGTTEHEVIYLNGTRVCRRHNPRITPLADRVTYLEGRVKAIEKDRADKVSRDKKIMEAVSRWLKP